MALPLFKKYFPLIGVEICFSFIPSVRFARVALSQLFFINSSAPLLKKGRAINFFFFLREFAQFERLIFPKKEKKKGEKEKKSEIWFGESKEPSGATDLITEAFSREDCLAFVIIWMHRSFDCGYVRRIAARRSENQFLPIFVREIPPRFRSVRDW